MNKLKTLFDQFTASQGDGISLAGFVLNLLLAALLSYILSRIYVRCGKALSNRKSFAGNFMLITMTTMLIITVVKSSLALSLGLVGALSIVRFRAAIKEPEELAYLFLTIAIGLALGADQRVIALAGFVVISAFIGMRYAITKDEESHNLYLTLTSRSPRDTLLQDAVEVLKRNSASVDLKRFDESNEQMEALLVVDFDSVDQLNRSRAQLRTLDESLRITFLDNRGI